MVNIWCHGRNIEIQVLSCCDPKFLFYQAYQLFVDKQLVSPEASVPSSLDPTALAQTYTEKKVQVHFSPTVLKSILYIKNLVMYVDLPFDMLNNLICLKTEDIPACDAKMHTKTSLANAKGNQQVFKDYCSAGSYNL